MTNRTEHEVAFYPIPALLKARRLRARLAQLLAETVRTDAAETAATCLLAA